MAMRLLAAIWTIAIGLLPIYIGESGGIQPGHVAVAVAAVGTLAACSVRVDWFVLTLLLFNGIVSGRCAWTVLSTADTKAVLPAAYFLFNAIALLSLRAFAERDGGMRFVARGIALSLAIAALGAPALGVAEAAPAGARITGTFNNPNQLGYFSNCALAILVALFCRGAFGATALLLGISVACLLTILSLSKAALVANAVGVSCVAMLLTNRTRHIVLTIALFVAGSCFATGLIESGALDDLPAVKRLRLIGQDADDSLEARGYGLLLSDELSDILLGRNSSDILTMLGHEVHSSIGSIFVEYGIVGGLLFLMLLRLCWQSLAVRDGLLATIAVLAPPLLYGLTHNGNRATIFWLLLAVTQTDPRLTAKCEGSFVAGAAQPVARQKRRLVRRGFHETRI